MDTQDQKKTFRLNKVDALIILIVIICALAIGVRYSSKLLAKVASPATYQMTIQVKGVRKYTVESLKKSKMLYETVKESEIGEIEEVTTQPAKEYIDKIDGTVVQAEVPERFDVTLRVKVAGNMLPDAVYSKGMIQLSVGAAMNFRTKYSEFEAKVIGLGT